MSGSENVYNIVQLGRQAGSFAAPGAAVPATFLFPVAEPVNFELDRGSVFPAEDYGRNVRNHTGRGYHGIRGAQGTLPAEVRFEDLMDLLEMSYAGSVTPTANTIAITSSSVANPSIITTATAHGITSGSTQTIAGHSGSTPAINGPQVCTVIDSTHFSIPVNVSVGGTGGTVTNGYKTWLYPFEAVAPTLIPYTIESGNTDASQTQHRIQSALIDELTLSFPDLTSPGAAPWAASASVLGFDRAISAYTGSLSARTGLESVQGHLTRIYEGTTGTAFAALSELSGSLVGYSQTASRHLTRRPYGGSDDLPTAFGFTELSNGAADAKVRVSATAKSDLHDIWNSAGASLGERRWRIESVGADGFKKLTIDARVGITAVPYDERDGERIYAVHAEFVDDSTLGASHTIAIQNKIASL